MRLGVVKINTRGHIAVEEKRIYEMDMVKQEDKETAKKTPLTKQNLQEGRCG